MLAKLKEFSWRIRRKVAWALMTFWSVALWVNLMNGHLMDAMVCTLGVFVGIGILSQEEIKYGA